MERIDKLISSFIGKGFSGEYNKKSYSNRNYYNKRSRDDDSKKDTFDFLKLIYGWEEIVGPRLSKHTIPLKNTFGNLTLLTNHSTYSQQLSFMEEGLKKKIFRKYPSLQGKIKRILFQTDPQYFEQHYENHILKSKNRVIEQKEKLHPFSPEYKTKKAQATKACEHVEDEELKSKLESLYMQID